MSDGVAPPSIDSGFVFRASNGEWYAVNADGEQSPSFTSFAKASAYLRDYTPPCLDCPDVTCPRCAGAGRIGWNPTVNHDPQYDEDHECPLCGEACVVTLTVAEAYLDGAAAHEDEFGRRAPDGWSARDFDPVTVTA